MRHAHFENFKIHCCIRFKTLHSIGSKPAPEFLFFDQISPNSLSSPIKTSKDYFQLNHSIKATSRRTWAVGDFLQTPFPISFMSLEQKRDFHDTLTTEIRDIKVSRTPSVSIYLLQQIRLEMVDYNRLWRRLMVYLLYNSRPIDLTA